MPLQSTFRPLGLIGAFLLVLSACGGGAADVVNGTGGTDSGTAGSGSSSDSGSTGTGSGSACGTGGTTAPTTGTDVVTYKNDVSRTGQNLTETTLTLTNVASATFGLRCTLSVDGKVDAQPLYLSQLTVAGAAHNVVFVATESDSVYAFDSDTGTALWHVSLLPSGESLSDTHGCSQVTPNIGITSTPVIDRSAGTHGAIYVVAMSKDQSSAYHQRLHALDVTTGAELFNGPVAITATYTAPGSVATSFEPGQYAERAALLLSQGIVYTSWTSHCDAPPYSGWIMGYNQTTLAQTSVLNIAPNNNSGPSIWMAGSGPGADSSGNIYLLSANGAFETTMDANGFPKNQDYGNSFLKIAATGTTLTVADYFTMSNEVAESNADQDLGSGGELLLPDLTDSTNTVRHLIVGAGKDGNIYLVNRDSMGKFSASSNNIWQQVSGALPGGIRGTPAYFNGTLYYGDNGATLKAFAITGAKITAMPSSQSATQFPYPGTAPAVSANGTSNGIVWAHENSGSKAVLHAYDATNLAHEIYNSGQAANNRDQFGAGNKFITPTVADGKVFVGTQNSVAVFGLLQ
jgi:outer membrane protein assembly factor BamB